jgi:hypothetical protein
MKEKGPAFKGKKKEQKEVRTGNRDDVPCHFHESLGTFIYGRQ